jgi:inorganic pyrophosphatase
MSINTWHDVDMERTAPDRVRAIIEISKGSRAKDELDKKAGILKLDRVLYSSFYYPTNYGFIPQTLGDDHDPLDILVMSQIDIEPLCIVRAKVIGVMRMIDSGEGDDKILAVAADDASVNHIEDATQIPEHFYSELRHFFEQYKTLENKKVLVDEFQGKAAAIEIIDRAIEKYAAEKPR